MISALTFLTRPRRPLADELDTALAGVQVGLQRRRKQWLLWLIEEKRIPLQSRLYANRAPVVPSAALTGSEVAEEESHVS
jgi:hypothetical protein